MDLTADSDGTTRMQAYQRLRIKPSKAAGLTLLKLVQQHLRPQDGWVCKRLHNMSVEMQGPDYARVACWFDGGGNFRMRAIEDRPA
jgi:hypothetical protein